jgi:hypothetical protein
MENLSKKGCIIFKFVIHFPTDVRKKEYLEIE